MSPGANPASSLAQELETAQELMQLLKQEQDLLVGAHIEDLSSLIQQKARLIASMSELAAARLDALAKAGYEAEESSMQKWMDGQQAASLNRTALKKSWDELLTIIRNAKELNRTNGLLIGTHMSRNQATLQVLQGNQGSQVYGPDGQTGVQTSRRSLVVG